MAKELRHIAFIMDGNGRWAKKRLMARSFGHRAGVKRIKEVITSAFEDHSIKTCSLYCFSTENWNRPEDEIETLFELLEEFFKEEIEYFKKKEVRIQISGFLSDERIPSNTRDILFKAMEETKDCTKHVFNVLFNYGSRQEIARACGKAALKCINEGREVSSITAEDIKENLFFNEDIDLLIRTSGEERLSNCLLFQCAYAEFIFTPVYWPDFDKKELARCIQIYETRDRRFGAIK